MNAPSERNKWRMPRIRGRAARPNVGEPLLNRIKMISLSKLLRCSPSRNRRSHSSSARN